LQGIFIFWSNEKKSSHYELYPGLLAWGFIVLLKTLTLQKAEPVYTYIGRLEQIWKLSFVKIHFGNDIYKKDHRPNIKEIEN
jgi:hypothetical protein